MLMEDNKLKEYTEILAKRAGEDEGYADDFLRRLSENKDVAEEYVYYLEHGDYACKNTIGGINVVDIIVWQMDHFKELLDMDQTEYKSNPYKMTLAAFDTMLFYADKAEELASKMSEATGTDYLGKY